MNFSVRQNIQIYIYKHIKREKIKKEKEGKLGGEGIEQEDRVRSVSRRRKKTAKRTLSYIFASLSTTTSTKKVMALVRAF